MDEFRIMSKRLIEYESYSIDSDITAVVYEFEHRDIYIEYNDIRRFRLLSPAVHIIL
jgi:hypothetical protein